MSTEERPYKGPLNWFPDRCCRMEGLELAASPSFLQTTCAERPDVSAGPTPAASWAVHTSPEPWGQQAQRGPRDTQTRSLHIYPHGHTCHPEQVTTGVWAEPRSCPVGPIDSEGSLGGGFRTPHPIGDPGSAPVNHPSLLAPARNQKGHVSARWVRVRRSLRGRPRDSPASRSKGSPSPAGPQWGCLLHLSKHHLCGRQSPGPPPGWEARSQTPRTGVEGRDMRHKRDQSWGPEAHSRDGQTHREQGPRSQGWGVRTGQGSRPLPPSPPGHHPFPTGRRDHSPSARPGRPPRGKCLTLHISRTMAFSFSLRSSSQLSWSCRSRLSCTSRTCREQGPGPGHGET